MTPAEKRIKELLDRWLTSIELHLQYVDLSDEAYAEIQAWPKHDRPTRWVLELAKQKANDLKVAIDSRQQMGDSKFADSLELMSFLANLVGAQHVERFVPLAEPQAESEIPKPVPKTVATAPASSDVPKWYAQAHAAQAQSAPLKNAATKPAPTPMPPTPPVQARPTPKPADPEATREMPRPTPPSSQSDVTREMPKVKPTPEPQPARKVEPKKAPPPVKPSAKPALPTSEIEKTVIADAVRLMGWGRTWHELAEGIARMADRPPQAEVRKILRANRALIEKSAKDAAK